MHGTAAGAQRYLDTALDLVQQHALTRADVDWPAVRAEARSRSAGAMEPSETYDAIRWVLAALGDGHSFFSAPATGAAAISQGDYRDEVTLPTSTVAAPRLRRITVPGFRGTQDDTVAYALALRAALSQDAAVDGWVVDVSANTGGNMLPMLAGLAPLLGDGEIGAFRYADGARIPWIHDRGGLWLGKDLVLQVPDTITSNAPVALVQGPRTASSGEIVVVAFRGRPRTRSFGLGTAGAITGNDEFELPDGATMAITVAWIEDRDGRSPRGPLHPDVTVVEPGLATERAALEWLARERA